MDCPENRFVLATRFAAPPGIVIGAAGRTPAASPDHHQGHLLVEAARFYSQLTKWDERFDGTAPYRVPHLVYAPFPFDAEQRHWHSTFVIDITDTFEQKMEAVACYDSQFDAQRFDKVKHFLTWDERLTSAVGAAFSTVNCSRCRIRSGRATCSHSSTAVREARPGRAAGTGASADGVNGTEATWGTNE